MTEATPQRAEATQSAEEIIGKVDVPAVRIDLDAVGAEYLSKALRESAIQRWEYACPEKLRQTDWQHPKIAPFAAQHAQIRSWQYQEKGLLASGPSGFGKSRAMWALMRTLAEQGHESRYFTAMEWFSALQMNVIFGRDECLGWVKSIARIPVVLIDDLGQEALQSAKQEWAQGWFFTFLDARLGNGLPLFVTTNLSSKQMVEKSSDVRGDPLVRRLLELCDVVKF